jgi:hypothetical protein
MFAIIQRKSFVFQFAIQKCKDWDIQNYNLASCCMWVWNFVSTIEEETQAEGFLE